MRVADYIFKFLADRGVTDVFLVTGGGAMFLNDALSKEKRLRPIFNLHEQACSYAAEGYARLKGHAGVVSVTSGPGGTNAITGVAGAWLDSIPMFVVSGQIKREMTMQNAPGVRQLGDQELNITDVVKPITKFAVQIRDKSETKNILEKAWYLANNGRPGPVWIDVPLDIQSAEIDPDTLTSCFDESEYAIPQITADTIKECAEILKKSERPAIICGYGVRCSGAEKDLLDTAERLNIPVLTAISGTDLITTSHPLFAGRPGILGARAANFIMQNCDCLLVLGSRMGIRTIGYACDKICRAATKIMVDIDRYELEKPTFKADVKVWSDVKNFLDLLKKELPEKAPQIKWLEYCERLKKQYPTILPVHRERKDYVSSYVLPEIIAANLSDNAIVVTGNATAYTSTFQTMPIKKGMRLLANVACSSMGFGLPCAIGAAAAADGKTVICLTGDGSIQMNIQEIQTVLNHKLPIKIFVYNNNGYLFIKHTQRGFFNGNYIGADPNSGVILPDLEKIAAAYGIDFFRIKNNTEAENTVPEILSSKESAIIEVMCDPFEELGPKAASKRLPDGTMVSAPLEDLAPFLPREEFRNNMIIPPVNEEF